jgi:hypothetical protein
VIGSFLGGWRRRHPERFAEIQHTVQELLAKSGMKMPIAARLPMARAAEAMRLVIERKAIGVVALEP